MPEATVNENHYLIARQDNIRPTGKVPTMQPEAIPESMEKRAHSDFRFRVRAADPAHDFAPLRKTVSVGHKPKRLTTIGASPRRSALSIL